MLNYSWAFGDYTSVGLGIKMQDFPVLSEPVPRLTHTQIAGRNGEFTMWDGSFGNRALTMKCFILAERAAEKLAKIQKALFGTMGYQKLTLSDDSTHYLMAQCTQGAEQCTIMGRLIGFTLKFDCMPQRFLTVGTIKFDVYGNAAVYPSNSLFCGDDIFPQAQVETLNNEWYDSIPSFTLYGDETEGWVRVNDTVIGLQRVPANGIVIDCDAMDAYSPDGSENLNSIVSISTGEFPTLHSGKNEIEWSDTGIKTITIKPRWWDL